MRGLTAATAVIPVLLLLPATADAGTYSLFTVGLGSSVSYERVRDYRADTDGSFGATLSLRLQILRYVALELGYAPKQGWDGDTQLVFASAYRVSAMLYPVHAERFGIYLKAGYGGSHLKDLITLTSPTNTYHFGGGFEVYLRDKFAVGAEFTTIVPGVGSIKSTMLRNIDKPDFKLGDFIRIENFRVGITGQYYF